MMTTEYRNCRILGDNGRTIFIGVYNWCGFAPYSRSAIPEKNQEEKAHLEHLNWNLLVQRPLTRKTRGRKRLRLNPGKKDWRQRPETRYLRLTRRYFRLPPFSTPTPDSSLRRSGGRRGSHDIYYGIYQTNCIKSFEPTFGKSSAMDEPAACKLKLKGKKRGFKPHTKRKIPNKYKEDSERSGFRTSIRKAKSGKVLCTSLR